MRHFLIPSLAQVHADNGGQAILTAGWRHPRRLLPSSVVILGIKGRVEVEVDGEQLEIAPGRFVVLPAGLVHRGSSPIAEKAAYYWLHFTLPQAGELLSQEEADTILSSEGVTSHLLENAAFLPLQGELPEPGPYLAAFHEILNEQEKPTYTGWKFQLLFQSFLIQLTEAVIRAHNPPVEVSPSSSVVYGILEEIAGGLTNPDLSIKGIATSLRLNLDYAGRRFRQVMGMSVGDYILKERLKLAQLKLQESTDTLPVVAQNCGFCSLRHFLRRFKAQMGMTPGEFRMHYRMMHINSL
ncbi:MAG TPA: AraC family transcriptional regulator [Rectinemataceae bacterium]|nr:AraC family transcriptional regulator [Rectinemataceae bacterium]